MLNMEKTVQMSDFISYAVSVTGGKIMLRHFTKKYVESRVSKLFITRSTWKLYFLFSNFGFGGVSHFPLYFLILTIHFSCLDQGLLPMVVGPFICWN